MMDRRIFLRQMATATALMPLQSLATSYLLGPELSRLTILHTNDVHSRVEAFPNDGSRNAGMGGAARRAALIKKIRAEEEHVLLLDSGDIFQGTPYFNFFAGEVEFKLMNAMGYDATTIGNHDFDLGIQNLADQLEIAEFKMLNANYIIKDTPLQKHVQAYQIIEKGGVRIGIFGLGIELNGLVPANLTGTTVYEDPIVKGNQTAKLLKDDEQCDLVICLSHLGYKYGSLDRVSDVMLAQQSRHIDLILGGHTHTFMKTAEQFTNLDGKPCLLNQAGWGGIMLGRLDLVFEKNKKGKCVSCQNVYLQQTLDIG